MVTYEAMIPQCEIPVVNILVVRLDIEVVTDIGEVTYESKNFKVSGSSRGCQTGRTQFFESG